jgi:hypothetical protein
MITSSKTSNQNENPTFSVAENLTHNPAQNNQNALPANITAYFDTVILPLWLLRCSVFMHARLSLWGVVVVGML